MQCPCDYILEHGLTCLTEKDLKDMLTFANAAAALIIQRKGALRVMPERQDVERLFTSLH